MTNSGDSNSNDGGGGILLLGPDLNATRPKMDKKLYRHITLPNGLQCVLICDTVALRRRRAMAMGGGYYDSDDDDEESDDDGSSNEEKCASVTDNNDPNSPNSDNDDNDNDTDDYDEDGIRKAATALLVNVGSYHDPPYLQGLSHFLEHMLFLGTELYPQENAYDAFLSKKGGDDNAYTDMEHTLYHYCIPQDPTSGNKIVWKALDMFASFFKCPLLTDNSVERELHAIESEFELNKKDDDNRLSQVQCFTSRGDVVGCGGNSDHPHIDESVHPFSKFPWGNLQSLKEEPESNGIDVMSELRQFYHTHYHAQNMRLVVMAGYELDEIQRRVVHCFRDVPAGPPPQYIIVRGDDADIAKNEVAADDCDGAGYMVTNLSSYGLPFHPTSLGKIYRIIPVQDHHTLSLTFQIPSITSHWRTKPTEYLAHIIGHEASGSILSVLKERGWATGLSAGTGGDGLGDASTHALFTIEMSLSKVGMTCWEDVINVVFVYIGMLRNNFLEGHEVVNKNECEEKKKVEGLPPWIYNELKSIANISYQFADEGDVTDIVEGIAENMAPWVNLPKERVLDGVELLFDDNVDNDTVKSLLFDHLTPDNMRVDLMSSTFGRDADFDESSMLHSDEEEKKEGAIDDAGEIRNPTFLSEEGLPSFIKESLGPAILEPRFGTKFWIENISEDVIYRWSCAATPQLPPTEFAIQLPPQNTYIPTKLDLRPADDAEHPLLNCCLKVCITVGKKKSWFPAAVTKYKIEEAVHRLSLTYEDEDEKWHSLDDYDAYRKFESEDEFLETGHEGSFDCGKVKFRVTAVPREGEGIVFSFGDSGHDDDVDDGVAFPPIPPPAPASRLPRLIYNKNSINVWHLQDRKFKRPIADLRIKFECGGMDGSALNQACMELFCKLCADALTETCYLASVCELGSSIYPTDTGFSIRVHGFDQNLLTLARVVLDVAMSFHSRDSESGLPSTIKDGRFDACLEVLLRKYSNAGMDASGLTTSLRLLCLRPSIKSPFSKMKAVLGITIDEFAQVMNNLMKRLSVDAFYHGNVNRMDADEAARVICESLTSRHVGIPKKKLSPYLVLKTKKSFNPHQIVVPTIDQKDPNTAVEVYFQFGIDDNSSDAIRQRVLVDLIELILEEPLYNQIRTKEQFGYEVSCSTRWTYGVLGMSFRIVTACKSAVETSNRIDEFLKSFRSDIESMDEQTFMEHLVALAKNKLESYDCLEEETSSHWSEITEGRLDFETNRKEVQCLKTISKDQLVKAYDEWLNPFCRGGKPTERRRMVFHVIGDGVSSMGRPEIEDVGEEIERVVRHFHSSVKNGSWGRISFVLPAQQ